MSDNYKSSGYQERSNGSSNRNYDQGNGNRSSYNSGNKSFGGNRGGKKPFRPGEEDFDENTFQLYKPYVGTGNQDTPGQILNQMAGIARKLDQFSFVTRTGGMEGPDEVFEAETTNLELYLPWRNFNDKQSKLTFNTKASLHVAKMFHPAFSGLKPAIQAFLAKNSRMILGNNLKSHAKFIICWSADGAESGNDCTAKTGNVGHVISMASAMLIPVFNLGNDDAENRLFKFLELENGKQSTNEEKSSSYGGSGNRDSGRDSNDRDAGNRDSSGPSRDSYRDSNRDSSGSSRDSGGSGNRDWNR